MREQPPLVVREKLIVPQVVLASTRGKLADGHNYDILSPKIGFFEHSLEMPHPPRVVDRDQHATVARPQRLGAYLPLVIQVEFLQIASLLLHLARIDPLGNHE